MLFMKQSILEKIVIAFFHQKERLSIKIFAKIIINKNQIITAREIKSELNIPFGDALHAIVAKDNDAILITRDKHFLEIDFIECYKPEDLI